jgi:hypothetical protein
MSAMTPFNSDLLAQLLAYAALLAGTIQYCEIVRHRGQRRTLEADRRAAEEAGLWGMVRVFLAEK